MRMSPPGHGRDGYILISVLAVVALLSGLVTALLLLGRSAADTAGLESRTLRQDALLQSAVTVVGYQLFVLKRPEGDVSGQQLRLEGGLVTVTVAPEAGKVDLNGSGKDLLESAYTASGLTSLTPRAFAARAMDWRDPDDTASQDGAEAAAYQGLGYGPRNGPFRSLDDLRFVLGIAPGDLERLQPFLTVYNAPGRLSAYAAPAALIAALPGVSAETSKEVQSVRQGRATGRAQRLSDLLLVQASLIDTSMPRTYRVRIDTRTDGRASGRSVTVVLSAAATADWPYQVLEWTESR